MEVPQTTEDQFIEAASSLSLTGSEPQHGAEIPSHRSHDQQTNQKRSDPFQFGSRFLTEEDDVFEFNAWDHVETDDAFKEFAEKQYDMQRLSPVSDFDKSKRNSSHSLNGGPISFVVMITKNA